MGRKPLWGIGQKTKVSVFNNVMNEYKKITKDDIDFPRYCFFFIKEIFESIEENNIENAGEEIEIILETSKHPYCYDALELVVRTLERKGFSCRVPTFHLEKKKEKKFYVYKWKITKHSNT